MWRWWSDKILLAGVALSAGAVLMSLSAHANITAVVPARDIRVGVNIHPSYGDPHAVVQALRRSGFVRFRMDAVPGVMADAMARSGFRGDYIVTDGPEPSGQLRVLSSLAVRFPGSVEFVEGRNEVNNRPTRFAGLLDTGGHDMSARAAIRAYMVRLVDNVRADPAFKGVQVIDHSDLHPLFAAGDYLNDHIYDNGHNRSFDWWADHEAQLWRDAAPQKPVAVTEWGFRTAGDKALTPQEQAASLTEAWAELLRAGVRLSYVYALRDDNEPYGIFNDDWSPKPAAEAWTRLNALLAASSQGSTVPAAAPTISDASGARHLLIARGDGGFLDLVWKPLVADPTPLTWTYDRPMQITPVLAVSPLQTVGTQPSFNRSAGEPLRRANYEGGLLVFELHPA